MDLLLLPTAPQTESLPARIRTLIVDDDAAICALLGALLGRLGDYDVVAETHPKRVMDLVAESEFDVVLLDLSMPGLHGLDVLQRLHEHDEHLPVIVQTGSGTEAAVEAMRMGACDFVTKPVEASVLDVRIRRAIENTQKARLAKTDGLTGLYNHRLFQERLEQEVDRARRYRHPISLMMIDVDRFKALNDLHGHVQGDVVLKDVARIFKEISRTSDVVARYGGDEFALILAETLQDNAIELGHRLREAVRSHDFPGLEGRRLTISVGVASQSEGRCKDTLVDAADAALYRAKKRLGDSVCGPA